jgi:hypothetical protein
MPKLLLMMFFLPMILAVVLAVHFNVSASLHFSKSESESVSVLVMEDN